MKIELDKKCCFDPQICRFHAQNTKIRTKIKKTLERADLDENLRFTQDQRFFKELALNKAFDREKVKKIHCT